jgi:The GLUG motif.
MLCVFVREMSAEANWVDYAAADFAGGDGTNEAPYLIDSAERLARLAYLVNGAQDDLDGKKFLEKSYRQIADIDLSGRSWLPIGAAYVDSSDIVPSFAGHYDGNSYAIRNVVIRSDGFATGLFCSAFGEEDRRVILENIRLVSVDVLGYRVNTGTLVGVTGHSELRSCSVNGGTVVLQGGIWVGLGGLVGINDGTGTIRGCSVDVRVATDNEREGNGDASAGGIIGINKGLLVDSAASGDVLASVGGDALDYCRAGGIVGLNDGGMIQNCIASGDVYIGRKTSGGPLVGRDNGTVTDSSGSGKVIKIVPGKDVADENDHLWNIVAAVATPPGMIVVLLCLILIAALVALWFFVRWMRKSEK